MRQRGRFSAVANSANATRENRLPCRLDEVVGHMREKVTLPEPGELPLYDRLKPEYTEYQKLQEKFRGK
ncbi:MAG: hypothetical protein M1119_07120 [Firmicutes bacterium]|nr:hypothetical protein [Bacillota bacterium]